MPQFAFYPTTKPKKVPLLICVTEMERATKTWYKKKEVIYSKCEIKEKYKKTYRKKQRRNEKKIGEIQ
jgi:hypothetical protein